VDVTEADGSEARALLPEGRLVLAQLRDVLAAEDSAVVTEEDHDRGAVGPERAESDYAAVAIGEDDRRKGAAERGLRVGHSSVLLVGLRPTPSSSQASRPGRTTGPTPAVRSGPSDTE